MSDIQYELPLPSMIDLQTIFTHFSPQDIEGFYQLYQLWALKQKREEIVAQIHALTQQIVENEVQLKATSPSTIALATLTQFQASGVDDIDLLDRMLERGDQWLDHALQLFERCERMDMIQGNVTEWCEHALEGAYEWIESMNETNEQSDSDDPDDDAIVNLSTTSTNQILSELEVETLPETTEEDFLQKLMSEDGEAQEQPEENKAVDEQQTTSDIEEEKEPAIAAITIEKENDVEDIIPSNTNADELASQESDEEDHSQAGDETSLTEDIQVEPLEEQAEQDNYPLEAILAHVSEYEEIEYAIPDKLPEVQQEYESIATPLQDQEAHAQSVEQEDDTATHVSEGEEIADSILAVSPEVQHESESSEIIYDDQTENISSAEQNAIDEDPQAEDSTIEVAKEEEEDITETPSFELNEAETEDIARKDTIETPSLTLNEPDIEDLTKAEEVSEPQEDIDISDEEGETQQIKALSHQLTDKDTEVQSIEQPLEQQPTNTTLEDDHPAELAFSVDEQAHKQSENEDLTDEDTAQPLQTADEVPSPAPSITPDTDITASLAAIQRGTTDANVEKEQDERAEYVREIAFAEAASELENNTPAGLSAPDIEDILPATTPNEVATHLEDGEPDIEQQAEGGTQKTATISGQQDIEEKEEEKKPQKQQQPKPRGFFRRLLAKLLHRR